MKAIQIIGLLVQLVLVTITRCTLALIKIPCWYVKSFIDHVPAIPGWRAQGYTRLGCLVSLFFNPGLSIYFHIHAVRCAHHSAVDVNDPESMRFSYQLWVKDFGQRYADHRAKGNGRVASARYARY